MRDYTGPVVVKWFGATGDGVTDDTSAIQDAFDECERLRDESPAGLGRAAVSIPRGDYSVTSITLEYSIDYKQVGRIICSQSTAACLTIGSSIPGTARIEGVYLEGDADNTWGNSGSIGFLSINQTSSQISVHAIDGFAIGMQCRGDAAGWAYNEIDLGRIIENEVGLDLDTINTGFVNENLFLNGRFDKRSGATRENDDRVGVRITSSDNSYLFNNNNVFLKPSFELVEPTPFPSDPLTEVAKPIHIVHGSYNHFLNYREEGNGNLVIQVDDGNYNTFESGYLATGGLFDETEEAGNIIYGGVKTSAERLTNVATFRLAELISSSANWKFTGMSILTTGTLEAAEEVGTGFHPYGKTAVAIAPARAVGVELDTRTTKRFRLSRGVANGAHGGRFLVRAWDNTGARVNDTEIFGDGTYSAGFFQGSWVGGTAGGDDSVNVRFGDTVERAWVGIAAESPNYSYLNSFTIEAYGFDPRPAVSPGFFAMSDVPNMYCIADATFGVTTTGSDVDQADDQTLSGDDLTPSGAGKVELITNWRNSQESFDVQSGEDLRVTSFAIPGALSQPYTIYWVGEWNTSGGFCMDGVTTGASIRRNGSNVTVEAGTDLTTSGQPTNGTPCIIRFIADGVNSFGAH